MLPIDPKEIGNQASFKYLVDSITPRPIAFVSTISKDGINNLSPFSFFNCFGSNPPILAFSPSRRGRDNTLKDTYFNLKETRECVVHIVNYNMVEQVSYASSEFDSHIDEFIKSGFTPIESKLVKPKRVKESPVHFECKVYDILEIGGKAGSGNLVICEVIYIHINDAILNDKGNIDPYKLDAVGRNGANWYTRANGNAIFELPKPTGIGIGYENLPDYIIKSEKFSANDLGVLIGYPNIPSVDDTITYFKDLIEIGFDIVSFEILERNGEFNKMAQMLLNKDLDYTYYERTAKVSLSQRDAEFAWNILIYSQRNIKWVRF